MLKPKYIRVGFIVIALVGSLGLGEAYSPSIPTESDNVEYIEMYDLEEEEETPEEEIIFFGGEPEPYYIKLEVVVTFYSDEENELEGGIYDRRGNILADYEFPVCAMPKDVPFNSKIEILDTVFTVVDTGGAIKWLGENKCKVDIFIPGKTTEWLNEHTGKFTTTAKYYPNYEEEN